MRVCLGRMLDGCNAVRTSIFRHLLKLSYASRGCILPRIHSINIPEIHRCAISIHSPHQLLPSTNLPTVAPPPPSL